MDVIVTVCAAFGLTVSEAKTEIMCLRTRRMPDAIATFSVEAAGQVYKQTHEFVYLGGNVNYHADLSIEVDRRIRNAWCSFRCNADSCEIGKTVVGLCDKTQCDFYLQSLEP